MRLAALFTAAVLLVWAPTASAQAKKYNLIAIVTDDQGQWALGAYGNKECRTPNMDRLAREGARFLNAFSPTPVCSPSRASFFTGRYGTEVGITDYLAPLEMERGGGLNTRFSTWMAALRRAGYATGLIGKWHLGNRPEFHPTKHGFDHFVGFLGGGNKPMDPTLEIEGKEQKVKGPLPDILTDHALEFIKHNKDRPFALSWHFRAPHLPYGPVPQEDSEPFKNLDPTIPKFPGLDIVKTRNWTRDYYASIHSVDRNLGRLLAALEQLGLLENTIILFTSDHGYMIGHHGLHAKGNGFWIVGGVNGPKRPNMFDLSVRVPLLVRGPIVARRGMELREMVSTIDTFPSVLGMLGVPVPKDVKQHGLDFAPLLRGQGVEWRQEVFGQYDLHNGGLAYMRMVRTEKWTLVRHHFTNLMDELYDLKNDPGEMKNLYQNQQHRAVREDLQARLTRWMESIDDPILKKGGR